MWASAVIEAEVSSNAGPSLGHAGIGTQVYLLVFDGSPEAVDKDVVALGAPAIHADLDLARGQHLDEVNGRELAALIRV